MPEPTDAPSAAVQMMADLAEFNPPAAPDTPPAATDDFMAGFDPPVEAAEPAAVVEEAPPEVTPPAADADEFGEAPANMPKKSREDWNKLRDTARTYKTKSEEVEKARIEELKVRDTELETLRKEAAELPTLRERAKLADDAEKELAVSRVEGTQEFKQTILAPLDAIATAVFAIADSNKENGVTADALLDAITERDPVKRRALMSEALANVDEADRLELHSMARDTQQLLAKRDQIRDRAADASKELEKLNGEKEVTAKRQSRESYQREVDTAATELRKRVPILVLADGETEDGVFAMLHEKAKNSDFDGAAPDVKARAALATFLLPRVTRQLQHVQEENKKLKARITSGNSTRATVGGGGASAPAAPADDGEDDFAASFNRKHGLPVRARPKFD